MHSTSIEFVVEKQGNVVVKVGESSIFVPKSIVKGGSIKWYEDKKKVGTA